MPTNRLVKLVKSLFVRFCLFFLAAESNDSSNAGTSIDNEASDIPLTEIDPLQTVWPVIQPKEPIELPSSAEPVADIPQHEEPIINEAIATNDDYPIEQTEEEHVAVAEADDALLAPNGPDTRTHAEPVEDVEMIVDKDIEEVDQEAIEEQEHHQLDTAGENIAIPAENDERIDEPETNEETTSQPSVNVDSSKPISENSYNSDAKVESPVLKTENTKSEETNPPSEESRKRKRSRSNDRSRSSKSASPRAKRVQRRSSPAHNIDDFTNEEDEPEYSESAVLLSWYDSDLNLKISPTDFCSARPLSDAAMGLAWAGARATFGVTSGKVAYEVQIQEINRIHNLSDERNLYELRCGWSIPSGNLQLGEADLSFGYSGCAKKATKNVFSEYGIKYGSRGDVVGVYLDLDSSPCRIEYTVNGVSQGVAFEFEKSELNDQPLFPHVLSKNLAFKVNFGQLEQLLVNEERPNRARREESSRRERRDKDNRSDSSSSRSKRDNDKSSGDESSRAKKENENGEELETHNSLENAKENDETETKGDEKDEKEKSDSKDPPQVQQDLLSGYTLIGHIEQDNLVHGITRPASRKDCEVILLIGLPGVGKTFWANNHANENNDKHYNILGIQNLLSKMTVGFYFLLYTQTNSELFGFFLSNDWNVLLSDGKY